MERKHMHFCLTVILAASVSCVWGIDNDRNYVSIIEPFDRTSEEPHEYYDFSNMTTVYFDGLGREIVRAELGNGGDYQTINILTEYDGLGNVIRVWQPVGHYTDNGYLTKTMHKNMAEGFYKDSYPYAEYQYDLSADMRISAEHRPGEWRNGKSIKNTYDFNTSSECRMFTVGIDGCLYNGGKYEEGTLSVTLSSDEDGNDVDIFTDYDGRTVMERKGGDAETHYVYDICGHLCYVVSPEAADQLTAKGKCDTVIVNKLCTYFRYDERGNMVERRLPGIAPEYFVYDKLDRLIFCQDGHLRKNEYWRFYAYDGKLRPALEGIAWLRGSTRESLQKAFKNKTVTAHMDSLVGYDMSMGYRLDSSFYTQKFTQAWYYDNYDYWTKFRSIPSHPDFPQDLAPSRMGKLTGQAVMAGGGTPIYTLRLYNKDDFEVITCEDKMNGEFCRTVFRRVNNFGQTVKELEIFDFIKGENQEFEGHTELSTQFSYMKPGGKISHLYSKIDNSSIFSCSYGYNDIGKLLYKHGAKDDPHFSYDVSGNIISMQGDIYSETLSYTPGGMIADKLAEYKVDGKTVSLGIEYTYDRLGRLTDAVAYESPCMSIPDEYTEGFSYDKNGNITSIARGLYGGRTQDCAIDYNGNQISRITDTSEGILASDAPRFESGSYENPFAYDNYGRITKDEIRGVTKILYNELSQPVVVSFKDGCEIRSIYSDDGTKRRTTETTRYITTIPVVNKGDTTYRDVMKTKSHTFTEYFGRLQRRNGEISRVDVGEGFFTKDPETGQWSSHSYIKDRLGSVVAVTGNNSAVEQYTLYFASGLPVVYDSDVTRPVNNRLHTGKEYLSFEGLHWYDNEARMYDPLLMRFTTPDPLAAQFPSVSPYAYCNNNPVNRIDPTGLSDFQIDQNGFITKVRDTDSDYHTIYASNKDGSINNQTFINVSKAFLNTNQKDNIIVYVPSSNINENKQVDIYKGAVDESTSFFEFAATNTNVEWSQIKYTQDGKYQSIVGTTHSENNDTSLDYSYSLIRDGNISVYEANHSHTKSLSASPADVDIRNSIMKTHPDLKTNIFVYGKNYEYSTSGEFFKELIVTPKNNIK